MVICKDVDLVRPGRRYFQTLEFHSYFILYFNHSKRIPSIKRVKQNTISTFSQKTRLHMSSSSSALDFHVVSKCLWPDHLERFWTHEFLWIREHEDVDPEAVLEVLGLDGEATLSLHDHNQVGNGHQDLVAFLKT
jgi:hypothetical protein